MKVSGSVTARAERNQVFFSIISELPARSDVVNLKVAGRAAILAAPPVASEHLERLILETNLQPALAQLAGRKVHLKGPEFHSASGLGAFAHSVTLPRNRAPTTTCRNSAASAKALA
jgi:hypothetical protein